MLSEKPHAAQTNDQCVSSWACPYVGLSVQYTTQETHLFWPKLHKVFPTTSLVNNFEKVDWAVVKSSALPSRPGYVPRRPESPPRSCGLVWNVTKSPHCSAFQCGLKMKYHVLHLKFTLSVYWPLTPSMKLLANIIIAKRIFIFFVCCLHWLINCWIAGGRKTLCEPW